jgi:hypothetical protein
METLIDIRNYEGIASQSSFILLHNFSYLCRLGSYKSQLRVRQGLFIYSGNLNVGLETTVKSCVFFLISFYFLVLN